MSHVKRLALMSVMLVAAAFAVPPSASAIPAFARKHNLVCSSCHAAVPYLNATGRAFKEAGWRMPDEEGLIDVEDQPGTQEVSNSLWLDKVFPIAARIKGYAVDKKKDKDAKIRLIHEIEIFSAGSFWKTGSWFFEIEGEDEDDFALGAAAEFGWHPHRAANIKGGFGSIFHPDPYNSLLDGGHRLTVAHKVPLDTGKSLNARLRKDAQYISFYGRTTGYGKNNSFFYMFGASAGNNNPEGENPRDFLVRGAYELTPDIMVGGFYLGGSRDLGDTEVDLTRLAVDFNLQFTDFYVLGMFMNAKDDPSSGTEEANNTGYIEGFYSARKDGRPFFVPLVRYDWTELNDGRDTFSAITLQAGVYAVENAKVALEYYKELDVPPGKDKLYRVTVLVDIAF